MKAAFDEAGFTPYTHFEAFGNSVDENISPTSQFDINFYLAAKSLELNDRVYQGKSDWTPEKVMQAFKDAGITAWDHYQQFGFMEDIAPNENFDSGKYFLAKVAELNSTNYEGRSDWTVAEVKQAFKDAGLTPVEHYAEYGKAENVDSYATGNANFKIVDNATEINKVVEDSGYDASTGVKDYTLAEALAAQADNTLSKVYNLTGDLDAGEVTVAQQAEIAKLKDGAANSADLTEDPTYILNDTYANLQSAPTAVLKFSGDAEGNNKSLIITDTIKAKGLLTDDGDINTAAITANLGLDLALNKDTLTLNLTGTNAGEVVSAYSMTHDANKADLLASVPGLEIASLAGGDGADWVVGHIKNDVLFAGSMTEKDANEVYAESQDSFAAKAAAPKGFEDSIGQYLNKGVHDKYFTGHNILDGREGVNDLVASNQADTFVIQLGGKTDSQGVTKEVPGENTIHQFNVGQDALFVMDQSDRNWVQDNNTWKESDDKLVFSGGWTKDDLDGAVKDGNITLAWSGKDSLTLTIKADFLNTQSNVATVNGNGTDWDVAKDLTVNFVGIQNADTGTTVADLFGITA